jgi:hypothetical protein
MKRYGGKQQRDKNYSQSPETGDGAAGDSAGAQPVIQLPHRSQPPRAIQNTATQEVRDLAPSAELELQSHIIHGGCDNNRASRKHNTHRPGQHFGGRGASNGQGRTKGEAEVAEWSRRRGVTEEGARFETQRSLMELNRAEATGQELDNMAEGGSLEDQDGGQGGQPDAGRTKHQQNQERDFFSLYSDQEQTTAKIQVEPAGMNLNELVRGSNSLASKLLDKLDTKQAAELVKNAKQGDEAHGKVTVNHSLSLDVPSEKTGQFAGSGMGSLAPAARDPAAAPKQSQVEEDEPDLEGEDGALPEARPIAFHRYFKYNSRKDNFMLFVGTASAIVAGLTLPSIALIMGSIASNFGDRDLDPSLMTEIIAQTSKLVVGVAVVIAVFAYIFFAFW